MSLTFYNTPVVTCAVSEDLPLVSGMSGFPWDERHAFSALMISRLTKPQLGPRQAVENYVACFSGMFPDLMTYLSTVRSMTTVVVPVTQAKLDGVFNNDFVASGDLAWILSRPAPDGGALVADSADGVFAALSSLVMCLGKDAGATADANIMKARPKALIERFALSANDQQLLPGGRFGPSHETMKQLYAAFSTYTEVRMKITQYFLGMSQTVGHLPRGPEMLMNNFRLLRGAQMAHVTAITKFMHMHPWSLRVPELRPYYEKFAHELEKFSAVPADVRQYHRLLVPQSDFLFVSADYRPLIAVAGDFVKEVEATFGSYVYNASDYTALIDKVRSYAPTQAKYVGTSLLAGLLNVQDQELPPQQSSSANAPETMI